MVKFCPHDLFVNTRADLGPCPKVHDDEAKAQFEKSRSYVKSQYTDEFIKFCNNLIHDVEKKIVKGRHRLSLIGQKMEPVSLCPLHFCLYFQKSPPEGEERHLVGWKSSFRKPCHST